MSPYDFELRFALPAGLIVTDDLIERLGEAGCDDALIGMGRPGMIALAFTREADSAHEAVFSAVTDVRSAIREAELLDVTPDLVGVTDVAELVGCSRQNIRNLMVTAGPKAPAAAHAGSATLWHLATILRWLAGDKAYAVNSELVELAEVTMNVNSALEALRTDPQTLKDVRSLLAAVPRLSRSTS